MELGTRSGHHQRVPVKTLPTERIPREVVVIARPTARLEHILTAVFQERWLEYKVV
jgi:hypothetical protein